MSKKLKRLGIGGRNDLSDRSRSDDNEQEQESDLDNVGDTASRLLQAFGTSRDHPLNIDSDIQSNLQEQEDSEALNDAEDVIVAESRSKEGSLRPAQFFIDLPILSREEKEEYEPLPGSSMVRRVLRRMHDDGGVQYNILFHDGHKETVRLNTAPFPVLESDLLFAL